MAATINQQIDESKQKLTEFRDDAVRRARQLQHDLTQQRQLLVGRVRDGGLQAALSAGAEALEMGGKLPLGSSFSDTLTARAKELGEARDRLQRPPIDDYDELNVKEVAEALEGLDAWQLEKVRAYEAEHKDRKTVYASIERQLR